VKLGGGWRVLELLNMHGRFQVDRNNENPKMLICGCGELFGKVCSVLLIGKAAEIKITSVI